MSTKREVRRLLRRVRAAKAQDDLTSQSTEELYAKLQEIIAKRGGDPSDAPSSAPIPADFLELHALLQEVREQQRDSAMRHARSVMLFPPTGSSRTTESLRAELRAILVDAGIDPDAPAPPGTEPDFVRVLEAAREESPTTSRPHGV